MLGAAAHGVAVGAVVQVASFAGLAAGLVLSALLAPLISRLGGGPLSRALLGLATLVVVTTVLSSVARSVAMRFWGRARQSALGRVDAAAGAVVGGAAMLVVVWLVASMAARLPASGLTNQIQHSKVLRALDGQLPAPPKVFARISRVLDPLGFPDVFAQFEPNPAPSLPLPGDAVVRAALAAGGRSTVKIEGVACDQLQDGSGFVASSDLVVTNAHVVAGVQRPSVIDAAGRHRATAVLFDPKMDVAVLRTTGLADPPLPMSATTVGRGTEGAALGYPGGGPLRVVPAVVLTKIPAIGRDIYGRSLTARDVYQLRADIRPGNSGGPLLRPDGTVVGVVFARSSLNPDLGFALTSAEVRPKVAAAQASAAPVSTGPCTAE